MGSHPIPKMTIRYSGLFDYDGMYAAIVDWAKNYGYKWQELDYKHKVPSPRGAEQELKWYMEKKLTHFMSEDINFNVHMWDMVEVEVDVGGKKKLLTSARIYIIIEAKLYWDWQKIFGQGKWAKKLGEWYDLITDKGVTVRWDTLNYRCMDLQALMKKYFDMQSKKYAYKGYLKEN